MNAVLHRKLLGILALRRGCVVALAVALISAGSQLVAEQAMAESPAPPKPETEVTIKRLGFGKSQITLRPSHARRLDIKIAEISEEPSGRKVTPFASIMYDLEGDAWVYTVPAPLTFVRESIVVEQIKGNVAYLKEGPKTGTQVVTVGVPELYGTEVGVNGE